MTQDKPIISTLTDIDTYKLWMNQFAFYNGFYVDVEYAFKNRTKIPLAKFVDIGQLREELQHVRSLRFTREEVDALAANQYTGTLLRRGYLDYLARVELTDIHVEVRNEDFDIRTEGQWVRSQPWETIVMGVVNELYFRQFDQEACRKEGQRRLEAKVATLLKYPFKYAEFGTRRRFSREWQEHVVLYLADHANEQLIGTSNLHIALKHNLKPIGTYGHEMPMVYAGMFWDQDDKEGHFWSHSKFLTDWWDMYGEALSFLLTDTYGSDFALRTFGEYRAKTWKTYRLDSGNLFEKADQIIAYLQSMGIDPMTKTLLPSDGMTETSMIDLYNHVKGRINYAPASGTFMTNDCGPDALSIVMKAVKANNKPLVKLSDNLNKASGDSEAVERAKRLAGYTNVEAAPLYS